MVDTQVMDEQAVAEWNHKVSEWHVLYGKLHSLTMAALNDTTSPIDQSDKVLSQLYMPWQDAKNWGQRLAQDPVSYEPIAKEALDELGKRIDSAVLLGNAMEPYWTKSKKFKQLVVAFDEKVLRESNHAKRRIHLPARPWVGPSK